MPGWDYSRNGYYYITMVIKGFDPILGHINNDEMILSDFGEIAFEEWIKSFEIRDELLMDEFTFMPDHMHAIIILKNQDGNGIGHGNDGNGIGNVQTHGRASLTHPIPNLIYTASLNLYHHLLPDTNRLQQQKLIVLLICIICLFQNTIGITDCGILIITIILYVTMANINALNNT
jgi:hypothetical protein